MRAQPESKPIFQHIGPNQRPAIDPTLPVAQIVQDVLLAIESYLRVTWGQITERNIVSCGATQRGSDRLEQSTLLQMMAID